MAQENEIAVKGEDLLLAVSLFELDSQQSLFDLAAPRLAWIEVELPRQLHGDGRPAHSLATFSDISEGSSQNSLSVDATVLEEVGIFCRQDRLLQELGDLTLVEQDALFSGVSGEFATVTVVELCDQRWSEVGQRIDPGHVDHGGETDAC